MQSKLNVKNVNDMCVGYVPVDDSADCGGFPSFTAEEEVPKPQTLADRLQDPYAEGKTVDSELWERVHFFQLYKLRAILGLGQFGVVLLVEDKTTNE